MRLAYCPECGMPVGFQTKRRNFVAEYEGRRYTYSANQALCERCGHDAVYPPYQEESGIAFNNAVRSSEGLVSLEAVREIPKRYAIGKRPLSRVLGLGEHTYSQLMNGQAPNREHSALIQRIYDDPAYYQALLESRKAYIADSTYERSRRATEAYMQHDFPAAFRLYELGRIFVYMAKGDITSMAIQKLSYYVQGFSGALLGKYCFDQMPRAWEAGPVYGQLWYEYREPAASYFAYREDEECSSPFTSDEDEIIRAVFQSFGCYSGSTLSRMTHRELPWCEARNRIGADPRESSTVSIRKEDMDVFFREIVEKYGITEPREIVRYSRDAFRAVSRER